MHVLFTHFFLKQQRFTQTFGCNVCRVTAVRQIEEPTAEPLVPEPSTSDVEIAIAKSKKHKSPGTDQIPAKLSQPGGEILHSKIHKLINSIWHIKQTA
jgi:hypothetical protein